MIRKTLWFVSVVSLALAPAFASAGGDKAAKDAGKSTSLTGCLAGTSEEDVYELKTKTGAQTGQTKKVEVRGQANLKEHVGHEVKLTGSWMEGSHRTSDAGAAGTEKEAARTQTEDRHFMVTDIQHVADSCKTK
jgi:hypothetical protein